MGDLAEAHPERAHRELVPRLVLAQRERALDQGFVTPAGDDPAEHVLGPGRRIQVGPGRVAGSRPARHRNRLLARGVGEGVAEWDQVQEMIGVQVADQDRIDVDVVDMVAEL